MSLKSNILEVHFQIDTDIVPATGSCGNGTELILGGEIWCGYNVMETMSLIFLVLVVCLTKLYFHQQWIGRLTQCCRVKTELFFKINYIVICFIFLSIFPKVFFLNFLVDTSFCGATDTPVLDFW